MELEAAKMIGAGLAAIALAGAGVGIGIIFGNYLSGAMRNPSAAQKQFPNLLLGFALWLAPTDYGNTTDGSSSGVDSYTPELLEELLAKDQPVFLNFTADWCVTCKVNEAIVLNQTSVKNALKSKNIVYLKADWTRKDAVIADKLAEYGRTGVPLYLLFSPEGVPTILPELLTEDILLSYINEIK